MLIKILRENKIGIASFLLALIFASIILFVLPKEREVKSLSIFLFKLLPFLFASLAIASVSRDMLKNKFVQYLVIISSYLVFFAFLIPKIIFHAEVFEELYYVLLVTAPYIILCFLTAYRLGGANGEQTFRLSIAMLLVMLSGIEDLAYFTVNVDPSFANLPEVWDWVTHIAVRIGHAPTKHEIMVSVVIHFGLAVAVLMYPFRGLKRFFADKGISLLAKN